MKRNRDSNSTLVLCLEGLLVLSSPIRTHYLNRNQQTTPVADLNLLSPVTIRSPAYPIYRLNLLMASAYTIGPPDLSSGNLHVANQWSIKPRSFATPRIHQLQHSNRLPPAPPETPCRRCATFILAFLLSGPATKNSFPLSPSSTI